jgi:hypothetical protein
MGLHINIYRCNKYGDCTNDGVSSWDIKGLCITNIDAPNSPSYDYPSAELVLQQHGNRKTVKIVPTETKGKHTMFGGNYGGISDSRFSETIEKMLGHTFYGAVPIHDRVEY